MIKENLIIPALLILCLLPVNAQVNKQEPGLRREVTLYNPYKPTLPEAKKRSFLPDMNDTITVRPVFRYDIISEPFMPEYTISAIKAASLLPDPLPKLYKSYINFGLGNYNTPLAEISISNERSKKGSVGFTGRHYSSNGNLKLQNDKKVYAGYMDNDISVFGKKFFKKNLFESSVDFSQKTRYAYGYDTSITDYSPERKDIRLNYNNMAAKASLSSLTFDSTIFSYDFDIYYDIFYNTRRLYQHSAGINGIMAKSFKGFYVGSGIEYNLFRVSDYLLPDPKYIASISPFVKKSTDQWTFKLGFQALIDKNMNSTADFHIYPDFNFGFNIVPAYIRFFAGLSGKLEKNNPLKIISENPFLVRNGSLFTLPNTDHELIVSAGLKGNTGLGGNYMISSSYSLISKMVFYSNIVYPDSIMGPIRGNYFSSFTDDVELLNIHGELNGNINDKISYNGTANFYRYTLAVYDFPWNKPEWDLNIGVKYNLRDKIIAGVDLTTLGKRKVIVNGDLSIQDILAPPLIIEMPVHFSLNISAEYRYSKILSFWARFNNITNNRYFEWAYYPSQRFLGMVGFTYSL